jgi:hypothetical protein
MPKYKVTTAEGTFMVTTDDSPATPAPAAKAAGGSTGLGPWGSNIPTLANEFVGGAVADTVKGLKDLVTTNPATTISNLGKRHGELLQGAADDFKAGNIVSGIGKGLYGVAPVIGPAMEAGMAKVMEGTPEEKARGAGNLAAMAFGPKVAGKAAEVVRPTLANVTRGMKESAATSMARAIQPKRGLSDNGLKEMSQKITPEMAERGVMATSLKRLRDKASEKVSEYGAKINDAWDDLTKDGQRVEVGSVADLIEREAIETFTIKGTGGKTATSANDLPLETAKGLAGKLRDLAEKQVIADADGSARTIYTMSAEQARGVRQAWDSIVAKSKGFDRSLPEQHLAAVHENAANSLRAKFADDFPSIAEVNKEFTFWRRLETITKDTVTRKEGQSPGLLKSIAKDSGMIAGAASGGPLGAFLGRYGMAALTELTSSTAWRTVSGSTKARLAKAIAAGDRPAAQTILKQMKNSILPGQVGQAVSRPAVAQEQRSSDRVAAR